MENQKDLNKDSYLPMKDGIRLFYNEEVPEKVKAMVIMVHGVCEHSGRYDHLATALHSNGYATFRFDLRGHGKSEGERGYAKTFLDFSRDIQIIILRIKRNFPGLPLFMLGHSMGAAIAVLHTIAFPGQVKGQVLSGLPAVVLPLSSIRLLKLLPYNMLPMVRAGNDLGKVVSRDPAVISDYTSDPLNLKKSTIKMSGEMFLKAPAWIAERIGEYQIPCLLLHGGADLIVTPASSEWFFNHIASTDKQRIVYPDLYHEIYNEKEKEQVVSDTIKWLDIHQNV